MIGEEKDLLYIEGERRVGLIDNDVTFDHCESQIRHVSRTGSSAIKIINSLKCDVMTICVRPA